MLDPITLNYTCQHCGAAILPTSREFCCAPAKQTAMALKDLVMSAVNEARAARAASRDEAQA